MCGEEAEAARPRWTRTYRCSGLSGGGGGRPWTLGVSRVPPCPRAPDSLHISSGLSSWAVGRRLGPPVPAVSSTPPVRLVLRRESCARGSGLTGGGRGRPWTWVPRACRRAAASPRSGLSPCQLRALCVRLEGRRRRLAQLTARYPCLLALRLARSSVPPRWPPPLRCLCLGRLILPRAPAGLC